MDVVVLVKSQFEFGDSSNMREDEVKFVVVRNVRSDEKRAKTCFEKLGFGDEVFEKIKNFVEESGQQWLGYIPSPITGHDGNVEYLAHLKRVGGSLRPN